jgi:hypothetical protein
VTAAAHIWRGKPPSAAEGGASLSRLIVVLLLPHLLVQVTTEDPGVEGLVRSGDSDLSFGTRVCIGGSSSDWWVLPHIDGGHGQHGPAASICPQLSRASPRCCCRFGGGAGGVAYVGIYSLSGTGTLSNTYYQPAFVFPNDLGSNAK